MGASDMLQELGESLASTATVKSVFGDPIYVDGKTVVPVARVALGFGAGFGAKLGACPFRLLLLSLCDRAQPAFRRRGCAS